MLRKLLTIALPLAVPFIAYWIYLKFARSRAGTAEEQPGWRQAPWTIIVVAAVALMSASLVVFGLTGGYEPGTKLAPPRVEDGKVVPAHPIAK